MIKSLKDLLDKFSRFTNSLVYDGGICKRLINKKISTFMKYSNDSFKKDVYYRLLKNGRYNWRKLLLLTSVKLLSKTCAFAKSY